MAGTSGHDVLAERGNRDHVVVGPAASTCLMRRCPPALLASVATPCPSSGPTTRAARTASMVSRRLCRAEAARLKARLASTACRTWVQALVVV